MGTFNRLEERRIFHTINDSSLTKVKRLQLIKVEQLSGQCIIKVMRRAMRQRSSPGVLAGHP